MINWNTISLKELAGYICEQLKKHHISTVLVGGACVTFYTRNQHASYDLDFVSYENRKDLKSVLELLGFHEHIEPLSPEGERGSMGRPPVFGPGCRHSQKP